VLGLRGNWLPHRVDLGVDLRQRAGSSRSFNAGRVDVDVPVLLEKTGSRFPCAWEIGPAPGGCVMKPATVSASAP